MKKVNSYIFFVIGFLKQNATVNLVSGSVVEEIFKIESQNISSTRSKMKHLGEKTLRQAKT